MSLADGKSRFAEAYPANSAHIDRGRRTHVASSALWLWPLNEARETLRGFARPTLEWRSKILILNSLSSARKSKAVALAPIRLGAKNDEAVALRIGERSEMATGI
jgi:hypothetical protein